MKKIFCYAVLTVCVLTSLTAANASPSKTTASAKPLAAAAKQAIPTYKLPYTFVCKHCGIKITVKTTADWLKPCPACPCGTNVIACLPDKKK